MFGKAIFRPGVVAVSVVLVVLVVSLAVVPASTQAATHSKWVRGYVYDQDGRKVPNAQVTVTMMNGPTQVSAKTDTSDSSGYFNTIFESTEWNIGNKIVVSAIYNSLEATNTTTLLCDDEFMQYENVTFPYEIPELGNGIAGFLVTGLLVGAIAVALLVFVRRKK